MKILMVVDRSPGSRAALDMMLALNLPPRTMVTVLTVVPRRGLLRGITLAVLGKGPSGKKEEQQKALELVHDTVSMLASRRLRVESRVRWGNAADEILRIAGQSMADLVVMGATGATDLPGIPLGGTAQAVMRQAKASVLVARSNSPGETSVNRVLLVTEGSAHAEAVAQILMELPLPQQSEIMIIALAQSGQPAVMETPVIQQEGVEPAGLRTAENSELKKVLAEVEKQFREKGYTTLSKVFTGGTVESILAAADEYKPDIVALGSRGLWPFESLVAGGVAEKVARSAVCSVLIGRAR